MYASVKDRDLKSGTTSFTSTSDDAVNSFTEMMGAIDDVKQSVDVPLCIKKALDSLASHMLTILQAKDKLIDVLRCENEQLRMKLARFEMPSQNSSQAASVLNVPIESQVVCNNAVDEFRAVNEAERRRSIVVSGILELKKGRLQDRVVYDFNSVRRVLDFLGIQCEPVAVYRLGKPTSNRNRLLKVVFPSSVFQKIALHRASRLWLYPQVGVRIRKSYSQEQLRRLRHDSGVRKSSVIPSPCGGEGLNSGNYARMSEAQYYPSHLN